MTRRNKNGEQEIGSLRGLRLEAERTKKGYSIIACPIVGVEDFSDTEIKLKGHGGRITVRGKRLMLSVLESGAVEILGKVEDISFDYGKN